MPHKVTTQPATVITAMPPAPVTTDLNVYAVEVEAFVHRSGHLPEGAHRWHLSTDTTSLARAATRVMLWLTGSMTSPEVRQWEVSPDRTRLDLMVSDGDYVDYTVVITKRGRA